MKNASRVLLMSILVFLLPCQVISMSAEETEWEKAKTTNNPDGYVDFLSNFPNGDYAKEAKIKLLNLIPGFIAVEIQNLNSKDDLLKRKGLQHLFFYADYLSDQLTGAIPFLIDHLDDSDLSKYLTIDPLLNPISGPSNLDSLSENILFAKVKHRIGDVLYIYNLKITPFYRFFRLVEPDYDFYVGDEALLLYIIGKTAVKPLIAALNRDEWQIRALSIWILGAMEEKSAVDPIIKALDDKDSTVRELAVWALAQIKDNRAVEPLLAKYQLSHESTRIKWQCAIALGEIGDPRAIEPLASTMGKKFTESLIPFYSTLALIRMKDNRAIQPLVDYIAHSERKVKIRATHVLKNQLSLGMINPIAKHLNNPDEDIRELCISLLNTFKTNELKPHFIKALNDESGNVRCAAANALANLGDKSSISLLSNLLSHEEWRVRRCAIAAMGSLKDNQILKYVEPALKDMEWEVRKAAVKALGELKEPNIINSITSSMNDEEWEVRKAAVEALGELKEPNIINSITSAIKDKDWEVRKAAVEALGKIKDLASVKTLTIALNDRDDDVRGAAVLVLQEFRDPAAIGQLGTRSLLDEENWVKKKALDAIGYFGKDGADYLLLKSNNYSKNSELYSNFTEALARTGVGQAHEKILSIATDSNNDASLRQEALKSLSKINKNEEIELLIKLLEDKNAEIKKYSLSRISSLLVQGDIIITDIAGSTYLARKFLPMESPDHESIITPYIPKLKEGQTAKALLSMLENEDPQLRSEAIWVLANLDMKSAASSIRALLKDPEWSVAFMAAQAMARFKDYESTNILLKGMLKEDPVEKFVAYRALKYLSGEDYGLNYGQWLNWSKQLINKNNPSN